MAELDVWLPTFRRGGMSLDRVGGLPIGLPDERWPHCGLCERPLAFIGQLTHDDERLDLGREGRVLYAFLCKNIESPECGYSAGVPGNEDGAHAIVLVDSPGAKQAEAPAGLDALAEDLVVSAWRKETETAADDLVDFLLYGAHAERPAPPIGWLSKSHHWGGMKIGGVPAWIQDPVHNDTRPDSKHYRCVAQWADVERVGKKQVWTTLEAGRLFLLAHDGDEGPEHELYYLAR
jgi:hypothetical protein